MFYQTVYPSPLGEITLVCDGEALVSLSLPGQKGFAQECAAGAHPILEAAMQWLDAYFAGNAPSPAALPLRPEGTAFRRLIWGLLLEIPYGKTVTYGTLAKKAAEALGKPRLSAQAVGQAVGANPIAIVIPCHRVVGADGKLTGYAGGIHYKKALLQLEAPEP
ncbi:MAG: methylated-DNA--[Oscillospiraceae bacterium]|nr:methylated-DNA--[protein]-cysteine S-methyltransferase [Oscillospiraceae bacterium]